MTSLNLPPAVTSPQTRPAKTRFGFANYPLPLPTNLNPADLAQRYSQKVGQNTPAYQMEQQGMPPSALIRYNPIYGNPLQYLEDRKTDNVPPLVNPQLFNWDTYRQYYNH